MKFHSTILMVAGASMALAACGSPPTAADREAQLRAATISVVAGLNPADVVISNVEATTIKVTWKAVAGGKVYACDADNQYRLPSCQPAV